MPRRRSGATLLPWLSARLDGAERRFIQAGNSLFFAPQFRCLSMGARVLYLCMALESGGKSYFTFPQAAALKYGFPPRSMRRYVQELRVSGFIELESSGKITREANQYCFAFRWKEKPFRDFSQHGEL